MFLVGSQVVGTEVSLTVSNCLPTVAFAQPVETVLYFFVCVAHEARHVFVISNSEHFVNSDNVAECLKYSAAVFKVKIRLFTLFREVQDDATE